jgi:predicted NAD/FAD-dependent oxidoreductase
MEPLREDTTRKPTRPRPRVAIIGGGISGLICARSLVDHGLEVVVFEKSRGVGGRMATRRTEAGPTFDHGAQYFTARDPIFRRYVSAWLDVGVAAPWEGRIATLNNGTLEAQQKQETRFVGVPSMNAICRHLSAGLEAVFSTRVLPPQRDDKCWRISDEGGNHLGVFDYVITSAPAPQSAVLLASAPRLQQQARQTSLRGCWAAMLAFDVSLGLHFDGAFVHDSLLSWVARNNSKPQRCGAGDTWVLHASPTWSDTHLEDDVNTLLPKLVDAFWQATGVPRRDPSFLRGHKWRYAIPSEPLDSRCLFDAELQIGACGDWCNGPRVEGAFLSGLTVAARVISAAGVSPGFLA